MMTAAVLTKSKYIRVPGAHRVEGSNDGDSFTILVGSVGNGGVDHQRQQQGPTTRQHLPGVTESNAATIQENDEVIEAYSVDGTTNTARGSNDGRINSAASAAAAGGGSGIPDIVHPAQFHNKNRDDRDLSMR